MTRIVSLILVLFTSIILVSEKTSANQIDRYIGQIAIEKEAIGQSGRFKGKIFILYHGDKLIIEKDNLSGKVWIIGIYYSDAEDNNIRECIIFFKKIEVASFDTMLNVNINGKSIRNCN